jgi:hypothetical protein
MAAAATAAVENDGGGGFTVVNSKYRKRRCRRQEKKDQQALPPQQSSEEMSRLMDDVLNTVASQHCDDNNEDDMSVAGSDAGIQDAFDEIDKLKRQITSLQQQVDFLTSLVGITKPSTIISDHPSDQTAVNGSGEGNPSNPSYASVTSRKLQGTIREAVLMTVYSDLHARESMLKNVVVYGLPRDENYADEELFVELCHNEFHYIPSVVRSTRLGKLLPDKVQHCSPCCWYYVTKGKPSTYLNGLKNYATQLMNTHAPTYTSPLTRPGPNVRPRTRLAVVDVRRPRPGPADATQTNRRQNNPLLPNPLKRRQANVAWLLTPLQTSRRVLPTSPRQVRLKPRQAPVSRTSRLGRPKLLQTTTSS